MNLQQELNKLKDQVNALNANLEAMRYQLDRIESKLPPKPILEKINQSIQKKNNKVVYTAMFGLYDKWEDPSEVDPEFDYVLFTDQNIKSKVYQVINLHHEDKLERKIKIVPHQIEQLKHYDVFIWHDASIKPVDPIAVSEIILADFTIMKHPSHDCVYQEANACLSARKDKRETIESQIDKYRKEGMPKKFGMVATGLHSKLNIPEVRDFCDRWWDEVNNHSRRDQLSFNYCLWKYKPTFELKYVPYKILNDKRKWKCSLHLMRKKY